MPKRIEELATLLGLSTGQLLAMAREITGDELRTTDLLTTAERNVLIAQLEHALEKSLLVLA